MIDKAKRLIRKIERIRETTVELDNETDMGRADGLSPFQIKKIGVYVAFIIKSLELIETSLSNSG